MKNAKSMSITSLEILAKSLSMRLTLDELEWLWNELREQAKEKRRQEGEPRRTWSVLSSENTPSSMISGGIRENR